MKPNQAVLKENSPYLMSMSIVLIIIAISFVLTPVVSFAASNPFNDHKNFVSGDEKFDKLFREARELHDKEEWKQAIEKFKEIVCDCPEKKYVDVAFYWLARSYKKLKMYSEAHTTIDRLLKNFPDSGWADDARVMKLELRSLIELGSVNTVRNTLPRAAAGGTRVVSGQQTPLITELNATLAGTYTLSPQTPLDREDEIKLAAFQTLMAADQKKGLEVMSDILKTESKASETLKREIIRTLRGPRFFRYPASGNYLIYENTPLPASNQQNLSLLRDTLFKGFQTESNTKIRSEIIHTLAGLSDEPSANYLVQLYNSESNKDIKKAIISSFGGNYSAYHVFGQVRKPVAAVNKGQIEEVVATTTTTSSSSPTNQKLTASSSPNPIRKIYFDKLFDIVRVEKDSELRRLAFSTFQAFSGWSSKEGMIETLSQLYDDEADEQFKISIIKSLGRINQNKATTKLLNIAKNDKSDKLKLEAIFSLRGSKDPEVLKVLEDLIK